ncbi:MAG: ABC transporter permease [Candidatus Omnitrophica bacterium]|nr:ABC transporter permease [Candidatus Omnitrophota bacterium]
MIDIAAIQMIWLRDLIRFTRDRAQILGAIARPVLWLLIMGFGLGSSFGRVGETSYLEFIFPGIIALNLIFASFLSAISIIWDREFGFLKEILVAPIPRFSIAVGKAASGSTVSLLHGLVVMLFIPLIHVQLTLGQILLALPLMYLMAFVSTSLGILIACRMTSFEGFGTIANFVIMPLFLLSGAVFPLDNAPVWLKIISRLNPFTYGVDLLRGVFSGVMHYSVALDLSVLFFCAAGFLGLAVMAFEKMD